jgi:proline iminopeptidase
MSTDIEMPHRDGPGVQRIPIETPRGRFEVWTRRVGDNPNAKLLFLHGGPGATHEYFEGADDHLAPAGIEYIYYDQLGSLYSDQPTDPELWDLDRFVDELEQVRTALRLDRESFFLLGHSWGGILATEYALRHQDHLKGLVISNMMASCPAYNGYADEVLKPSMDQDALAEIQALEAAGDTENPRYMELLGEHHYQHHVLRVSADAIPDAARRGIRINQQIYVQMQGPSELGLSGSLTDWDRSADLHKITTPTLVIGAAHDTMDPAYMAWMASQLPDGRYLHCPNGSHMAMWDDEAVYWEGLLQFIRSVEPEA